MESNLKIFILAIVLIITQQSTAKVYLMTSPDKKNTIEINTNNKISYSVKRNGDLLLAPSILTIQVGKNTWGANTDNPISAIIKAVNETVIPQVAHKFKSIQDNYNQLILKYKDYNIEFRAYNDGVAYRFVGNTKVIDEVRSEEVNFNFEKDYESYTLQTNKLQNWYEENYTIKPISKLSKDSFSLAPVMVDLIKYKVILAESNLYNYAGMYLQPQTNGFNGLFANYPKVEKYFEGTNKIYATEREDYIVKSPLNRIFPWRVMGIFDTEKDILTSQLIYLLSDRSDAKTDYSWVKPGKVLWDWWNNRNIYNVDFESGINTATYIYMVDFAQKNGIEYILLDLGWSAEDDLLTLNPEVDVPKICKYANEKNVGIILWAKWINVDKQLDASFDKMKSWGVKGVKIDFMDRNDAKMVNFYERVAKKAQDCKFLVDFHGSYPNDGMLRKYPFLMTREGVLGMEYDKWSNKATPKHDVMISYLRMWVGPMDYTPGAMLNAQPETFYSNQYEPMSQGTRVHQMAMYVVYESPLQMLSDSPTKYADNQECFDFIKKVPVVWDNTISLSGNIQKNIVVARQKGDKWYVGAIGGTDAQEIEIDFSFLKEGKYKMELFKDGVNADVNGKDYKLYNMDVFSTDKLKIKLARGGGFVAVLSKQ